MDVASILLLLLVAIRCRCDHSGFSNNNGNSASRFGELLKPPPPPPLSQILPVPFHGGAGRNQRQNEDIGYQYQPPPPPPQSVPSVPASNDFKFPAPFYKQYNFNFVPPPQPFTTTPSPTLFQKVSGWLFPSQQTSYDIGSTAYSNNIAPLKKDCNPCNLVPWIPVLRYNLGAKNVYQNSPTYGPPSPTALGNFQNPIQYQPQPFYTQNEDQKQIQLNNGEPQQNYGVPNHIYNSNSVGVISSTYGPPSPTHTIGFTSQSPPSSTFSAPSSSLRVPSTSYELPTSVGQPSSSYLPTPSQGISITTYNGPSSTYRPPTSSYATPSPLYETGHPITTTYGPVTPNYATVNSELPYQSDVGKFSEVELSGDLQLPKVSHPTEFKNSYGETITNPYALNNPYPVSATAAESSKVKTEVLPLDVTKQSTQNMSVALANPAPFTLNRGRNIHTLQPVALPNLSVSPLPPIFNARPFRPIPVPFPTNIVQGINQMQQSSNVNIAQSVPLIEFTHSVEYPTSYIQSPVIDIDASKNVNHTKAFRNIPNSFIVDEIKDIYSQASEDHISATKSIPDSSFESTGSDVGNDLYDASIPIDLKQTAFVPSNHKSNFADLRGVKDEDVDKYRTESNLQNIDSPLLYLKPSAPHKSFGNFMLAVSTPVNKNEYEIYDDLPTTIAPKLTFLSSGWDESRSEFSDSLSHPPVKNHVYKPKIVQIIVPYTTGKIGNKNSKGNGNVRDWDVNPVKDYQARKIPSVTENYGSTVTEHYSISSTTTEEPTTTATENYDSDRFSSAAMPNDLYDVKEPPFDIIKLQHTIDDWTEQEYSKHKPPQRARSNEKYAKQIPDEYFTTTIPTDYVTEISNYNYDFYDHEGSSSIQHTVTEENDHIMSNPRKEYNVIERTKNGHTSGKNEDRDQIEKFHIYTAASSFRTSTTSATTSTTTTTPAPWGKIQTSISPLTKEKVYVVTSKPWRDTSNVSKEWYNVEPFESKRTNPEADVPSSDSLPFKSPRFMNRPSFGFTSGGKIESVKSDSSYGFSKSWYQSINELETQAQNNTTSLSEDFHQTDSTNLDEDSAGITRTDRHKHNMNV